MLTIISRVQGPLTRDNAETFDHYAAKDHPLRELMLADACERAAYALLKGTQYAQHEHAWRAVAIARSLEA